MNDEPPFGDRFLFKLPVFIIVNEKAYHELSPAASVAIFATEEHGNTVALFTEEGFAQQFLVGQGKKEDASLGIGSAAALRRVLTGVAKSGVKYVAIDPLTRDTFTGQFSPISDLLDALPH